MLSFCIPSVYIKMPRHQKVNDFFPSISRAFMKGHLTCAVSLFLSRLKQYDKSFDDGEKKRRNVFFLHIFNELTNWLSRFQIKPNLIPRMPIWMKCGMLMLWLMFIEKTDCSHSISVLLLLMVEVVVFNRIDDIPHRFKIMWMRGLKFVLCHKCLLGPFFHILAHFAP